MTALTRRVSLLLLGALFSLTVLAAQKPYLVDGDADAVSDEIDECPYTQPGMQVDRKGCPLRRDDEDLDGVPNHADDCPYSAVGAVVDQKGCALDDDFDGVANGIDRCPRTLLVLPVNAAGCAASERAEAPAPAVRQPGPSASPSKIAAPAPATASADKVAASAEAPQLLLRFVANSDRLGEIDLAMIQGYAKIFQRRLASVPTAKLQLQAYADGRESEPTGRSAARLMAVRSALLAHGIAAERIKSSAGVLQDGGATQNRRVEVKLLN